MILLDTNIVIYAADPLYPGIIQFVAENDTAVSVVSSVEALGFPGLLAADRASLEGFFAAVIVHPIDQRVVDKAIELRQRRKMGYLLLGQPSYTAFRLPRPTCAIFSGYQSWS